MVRVGSCTRRPGAHSAYRRSVRKDNDTVIAHKGEPGGQKGGGGQQGKPPRGLLSAAGGAYWPVATDPCPSHEWVGGGAPPVTCHPMPLLCRCSLSLPRRVPDFLCFATPCRVCTEEGNGPRRWSRASTGTSRAGGARLSAATLGPYLRGHGGGRGSALMWAEGQSHTAARAGEGGQTPKQTS